MSTSKKRTTNTRQVSQAAESTGSDLSSHEDQIQSLMDVFNFSCAKAEEEVGRLNQIAKSTDGDQEVLTTPLSTARPVPHSGPLLFYFNYSWLDLTIN